MVSSTDSIVVPLSADVTTANIPDNQVHPEMSSSLSSEIIRKTHFMVADQGYDDQSLYDLSLKMGFQCLIDQLAVILQFGCYQILPVLNGLPLDLHL
jgi:hypothetical protein